MILQTYIQKLCTIALLIFICNINAQATTYTVVKTGVYTDNATWSGGSAPPLTLLSGDEIVVPANFTLTLDTSVVITASNTGLTVDGTVISQIKIIPPTKVLIYSLTLGDVKFGGSGSVTLDTLIAKQGLVIDYSGAMTVRNFHVHGLEHKLAQITVTQNLDLLENEYLLTSGQLTMDANSNINMHSGKFNVPSSTSGTLDFSKRHNIIYNLNPSGNPKTFGQELKPGAIQDILLYEDVKAEDDIAFNGLIYPKNHKVILDDHALTLHPECMIMDADMKLHVTKESELTIRTAKQTNQYSVDFLHSSPDFHSPLKRLIVDINNGTFPLKDHIIINKELGFMNGHITISGLNDITIDTFATITGARESKYIIIDDTFRKTSSYAYHDMPYLSIYTKPGDTTYFPIGTKDEYAPMRMVNKTQDTTGEFLYASVNKGVKQHGDDGDKFTTRQDEIVKLTWAAIYKGQTTSQKDSLYFETWWKPVSEGATFDRNSCNHYTQSYFDTSTMGLKWNQLLKQPGDSTYKARLNAHGYYYLESTVPAHNFPNPSHPYAVTFISIFDPAFNLDVVNTAKPSETINIYPNPAQYVLHVSLKEAQPVQATVYNISGQAVVKSMISAGDNTIDISTLPAGAYYIQLKGEQTNATGKFIKQ